MRALLYAVAGLLGIALVACDYQDEARDLTQPEIKQNVTEYQKVLPGKWVHDMAFMQKESEKLRSVIIEVAKSQNSAEFSKEFKAGLDSLIAKTERNWQEWNVEFFFNESNLFRGKMSRRPEQIFDVSYRVKPFNISFGVTDKIGSLVVASLEEPHLTNDVLTWHEIMRIPGTKEDFTITHRCIRAK